MLGLGIVAFDDPPGKLSAAVPHIERPLTREDCETSTELEPAGDDFDKTHVGVLSEGPSQATRDENGATFDVGRVVLELNIAAQGHRAVGARDRTPPHGLVVTERGRPCHQNVGQGGSNTAPPDVATEQRLTIECTSKRLELCVMCNAPPLEAASHSSIIESATRVNPEFPVIEMAPPLLALQPKIRESRMRMVLVL